MALQAVDAVILVVSARRESGPNSSESVSASQPRVALSTVLNELDKDGPPSTGCRDVSTRFGSCIADVVAYGNVPT